MKTRDTTIEVQFACGHRRDLEAGRPSKPRVIERSRRCPDCCGVQYSVADNCDVQISFVRFSPVDGERTFFEDIELPCITTRVLCLRGKNHTTPHLVANPNTGELQEVPL